MLNPGRSHVMDYNDQCFYISISSEEDSHITAYKEPKEPLRLFRGSFRGNKDSFITASSIALELRGENAGSSKRKIDPGVVKNPRVIKIVLLSALSPGHINGRRGLSPLYQPCLLPRYEFFNMIV